MKGIYLITNKSDGKRYVGLSINIKRRFCEHKSPCRAKNVKTELYDALKKYSLDDFVFEILEEITDMSILAEREIYWIDKLKPEYNMTKGGFGNVGREYSEETKSILRKAGKAQWESKSLEEKERIIKNNLTGQGARAFFSIETRAKLRAHNLGKKQSRETIEKRAAKLRISCIGMKNGNKKVLAYKDGIFVKEYESIKIAADEVNVHPSNITKVLKGVQKTAAGHTWKYKQQNI